MKQVGIYLLIVLLMVQPLQYPISSPISDRMISDQVSDLISYPAGQLYLAKNSDLQEIGISPLVELQTIPYSIIRTSSPIKTSLKLWQNSQIRLDTGTPQPLTFDDYQSQVSIDQAWDLNYNGSGVVIAVIDTGINFNHRALWGKMVEEASFHAEEYGYTGSKGPADDHGHGTGVASLVAGNDPGRFQAGAFNATLVNAKLGIEDGFITALSLIGALDWVNTLDYVDVITMSLSEPEENYDIDPLEELTNEAVRRGKIVISSAGNRGSSGDNPHSIGSPGSAPEAITVGATSSTSSPASFSSEGPNYGNEAKPDLMAPGVGIPIATLTTNYGSASGTSYSTPIVASATAMLIQAMRLENIDIIPASVKAILGHSATDLGISHYKQGFGLLNISRAIQSMHSTHNTPLIAPKEGSVSPIEIPLLTQVSFTMSVIKMSVLSITTDNSNTDLQYSEIYNGNTSVFRIFIELNDGFVGSTLDLIVTSNETSITYTLPILVLPQPEFQVLLDLKHTVLDSINTSPVGRALERITAPDLILFTESVKNQQGWVTEFFGEELTVDLLSMYDAVMIPSAFMYTSPAFYDHRYQNVELEVDEVFALHQYYMNGGNIIIDFGGSTSYDSGFTFTHGQQSRTRLAHLLGVEIGSTGHTDTRYLTINSPILDTNMIWGGNYPFKSGIPFVDGSDGFSAIGLISEGGGRVYAHNNRNWRTSLGYNDHYVSNVTSWLFSSQVVPRIHSSYLGLTIELNPTFLSDLENIEVDLNRDGFQSNSFEITDNGVFFSKTEAETPHVDISISYEGEVIFLYDAVLPKRGELSLGDVSVQNGDLVGSVSFENIDLSTQVMRIVGNDYTLDTTFEIIDNTLFFNANTEDTLDELTLQILDDQSILYEQSLNDGVNTITTSTKSNQTSTTAETYLYFPFVAILVAIIVGVRYFTKRSTHK